MIIRRLFSEDFSWLFCFFCNSDKIVFVKLCFRSISIVFLILISFQLTEHSQTVCQCQRSCFIFIFIRGHLLFSSTLGKLSHGDSRNFSSNLSNLASPTKPKRFETNSKDDREIIYNLMSRREKRVESFPVLITKSKEEKSNQ